MQLSYYRIETIAETNQEALRKGDKDVMLQSIHIMVAKCVKRRWRAAWLSLSWYRIARAALMVRHSL